MGFLDKIFGRKDTSSGHRYPQQGQYRPQAGYPGQAGRGQAGARTPQQVGDEQAIARYRYMLRTAPPERIEAAHAEAFAQLSPEQRQQVLRQLSDLPEAERPRSDDPQEMARAATRAEMRQPGYLQTAFAGPGLGGMFATSMLGTVAGVMVGSMIADAMFDGYGDSPEAAEAGEAGIADPSSEGALPDSGEAGDGGDAGGDYAGGDYAGGDYAGGDYAGGDYAGGEAGGDYGAADYSGGGGYSGDDYSSGGVDSGFGGGDSGGGFGDFGGGDFGGGDFGGGDF